MLAESLLVAAALVADGLLVVDHERRAEVADQFDYVTTTYL
jgi:hypothetical protein